MFCQNWRSKIKRPRAWNMSGQILRKFSLKVTFSGGTIQAAFLTGGTCTLPRWPLLERHFWQCQQHTNFSTLLPAVPIYRKEARTCARAVAPIHDLFITPTYLMGLLEHTIFQPNPFSVPEIWNRDARLCASRCARKMSYAKRLAVECLSTY